MSISKKESKYDEHFSRISPESIVCDHCAKNGVRKTYVHASGGSTSGLRRHLFNKHQVVVDKPEVGPLSFAISKLVQEKSVDLQLVASKQFKTVIDVARLFPAESIPSITTVCELAHSDYNALIKRIKEEVRDSSFVTVVLDHWSSHDVKSYIGVIFEYLTPKFVYKSQLIDFEIVGEHGAMYTFDTLKDQLKEFRVLTKLGGIVGDSTAAMKKTLEITSKETKCFDHLCFCHILQLCINDGLDSEGNVLLKKALAALKKIVEFSRSSGKFLEFFRKRLAEDGKKFITPKQHNKTRWDSVFLMLESMVFYLDDYNRALKVYGIQNRNSSVPQALSNSEQLVIFKIYSILGMLRNVTLQSQVTTTSISALIPLCSYIEKCIILCEKDSNNYVKQFGADFKRGFERRICFHYKTEENWKDQYVIATFLDVTYKDFLQKLENYDTLKQQFIDTVNITSSFSSTIPLPTKKIPKFSMQSMIHVVHHEEDLMVYFGQQHDPQTSEVLEFILDSNIDNLPILEWWNKKKKVYPQLAVLARKFLCIPISSASIERTFSHAKQILKVNRSQLSEFKRKELLILKVNSCAKSNGY